MLHIVLLIFKVIGIILLVLIGLLLLMLITVMLVPIRYRATVTHGEEIYAEGGVSWLLHMIGAKYSYMEGKHHIRIRILWITLFDNLKPRKPKIKKSKRKASKMKRKSEQKSNTKKIKKSSSQVNINAAIPHKEVGKDILKPGTSSETHKEAAEGTIDNPLKEEGKLQDKSVTVSMIDSQENEEDKLLDELKSVKRKDSQEGKQGELLDKLVSERRKDSQEKEEEKESVFHKLICKMKAVKDRIVEFFGGLKHRISGWFHKFDEIKHKTDMILEFIRNEYNKEGFHITYNSLKKLLKHLLPTKLKSKIIFGTGDPCSTGQALGAMSILYSFYGDKVVIIPDFENKRFEGEHFARGRIRLITLLIIVIRLILDKRFKQLKNNFIVLKEAL